MYAGGKNERMNKPRQGELEIDRQTSKTLTAARLNWLSKESNNLIRSADASLALFFVKEMYVSVSVRT